MINQSLLISFQMSAGVVVERDLLLPPSRDRRAPVPCKNVEQRSLDPLEGSTVFGADSGIYTCWWWLKWKI